MDTLFWHALLFRFLQLPRLKLNPSVLAQPSQLNLLLGLVLAVYKWYNFLLCFARRFRRFWERIGVPSLRRNHLFLDNSCFKRIETRRASYFRSQSGRVWSWTLKILHVCAMKLYVVQKKSTERPGTLLLTWRHVTGFVLLCLAVCCVSTLRQRFSEAEKTQQQFQAIWEAVFLCFASTYCKYRVWKAGALLLVRFSARAFNLPLRGAQLQRFQLRRSCAEGGHDSWCRCKQRWTERKRFWAGGDLSSEKWLWPANTKAAAGLIGRFHWQADVPW